MSYGVKYIFNSPKGDILKISQKDYSGDVLKIRGVQSLSYGIEGGQLDPDEPIIKTSLTLSLVNAPDLAVEADEKCGNWEEFFTPDPLMYKVQLWNSSEDTVLWSGYITPDSWEEDLVYHGIINIKCRDNISHLQGVEYKGEGSNDGVLTLVMFLMANAARICGFRTSAELSTTPIRYYYTKNDGTQGWGVLRTACVDITDLLGKTWYEVLESVARSFGLVVRAKGDTLTYCHISQISDHLLKYHDTVPLTFINRSGFRALKPAARAGVEEDSFSFRDSESDDDLAGAERAETPWTATFSSATFKIAAEQFDGNTWKTVQPSQATYQYQTPYLLDKLFTGSKGNEYVAIGAHRGVTAASASLFGYFYRRYFVAPSTECTLSASVGKKLYKIYGDLDHGSPTGTNKLALEVVWVPYSGSASYLNPSTGAWVATRGPLCEVTSAKACNVNTGTEEFTSGDFTFTTPATFGRLEVRVLSVGNTSLNQTYYVRYALFGGMNLEMNVEGLTDKSKTSVILDEDQNTTYNLSPSFAQYPGSLPFGTVKNAVYADDYANGYPTIEGWTDDPNGFLGNNPRYRSLAEFNLRALLTYYYTIANTLEGDAISDDYYQDASVMHVGYDYRNIVPLVMLGGSFDVINHRYIGAYFHEARSFADLWGNGFRCEEIIPWGAFFKVKFTSEVPCTMEIQDPEDILHVREGTEDAYGSVIDPDEDGLYHVGGDGPTWLWILTNSATFTGTSLAFLPDSVSGGNAVEIDL